MGSFVVAGFLLTSASCGPSAIAELLGSICHCHEQAVKLSQRNRLLFAAVWTVV